MGREKMKEQTNNNYKDDNQEIIEIETDMGFAENYINLSNSKSTCF